MRKHIKKETITKESSETSEELTPSDMITKKPPNSMRIILRSLIVLISYLISLNFASSSKDSKEQNNFLLLKFLRKKMGQLNAWSKTYKLIYYSISFTWRSKALLITALMKSLENISKQQLNSRNNLSKNSEMKVVRLNRKNIPTQISTMKSLNILMTTKRILIPQF